MIEEAKQWFLTVDNPLLTISVTVLGLFRGLQDVNRDVDLVSGSRIDVLTVNEEKSIGTYTCCVPDSWGTCLRASRSPSYLQFYD